MSVSKAEYDEYGPAIVHSKCFLVSWSDSMPTFWISYLQMVLIEVVACGVEIVFFFSFVFLLVFGEWEFEKV